ncbi:hypothetical protein BDP27DRAFT_1420939 [Rhodocollybia butyracea]|uniref:DUF6533 domain-containing protein n=1 Tax=Rhodocollybia butyracea TaxID=206335 RepID=A0A9P5U850_9AGAR|nr:hypothetical protein BDP27DRAFT_1420939 [Rhodocollybia butyracea]
MSDPSSESIAEEIINLQFFSLFSNYVAVSAYVLWFYDFFLTLPAESRSIWSSRLTGTSILFILSRYSFLLFAAIGLAIFLPGKMTDTRTLSFTGTIIYRTSDAATKLLSILRVYALFGQKRLLLFLLCPFIITDTVGAILKQFSLTVTTSQGTLVEPFTRCSITGSIWYLCKLLYLCNTSSLIVSPLLQLAFDSIIFILTLFKTARHIMQSRKSGMRSIAEVILHDGTLYFFTIFVITTFQAAFALDSVFSGGAISNTGEQITITFTSFLGVLSNLLINRFVLNLRAFSNRTIPTHMFGTTESRFIGNMGALLDFDQWTK